MIRRPDYVDAILPFVDAPLVKILSGVRRCGKSTILEMMKDEFLNRGVKAESIIGRNYASVEYGEDFLAKDMYADLLSAIGGKGRCYLFLDELQEIDGWEKVVNTLMESTDVDIYVTGSNSKLMSSEISTYLSGRYVSIPVYTLSLREYMAFKDAEDRYSAFESYLQYGGFPVIGISRFDTRSAYQIVDDIYTAVVTRDISRRHRIRNKALFDRVVRFIIENVGKTFSAVETIYNYLKWLQEAFIIYPCQRYDLQGKAVLKTQEKYYLSDISLKYGQLGFDNKMIAAMLENIVFLEMKRRGYEVYIGKIGSKEIDFIGILRDEKVYVQVCRTIPENSDRETENLKEIRDHYHKYVVAMDKLAIGNDEGIAFVHIADFLLMDKW